MSKSDLIKIQARALNQPRRCRGGHCFTKEWSEAHVTEEQLQAIAADPYLEYGITDEEVIANATNEPPAPELTDAEKIEQLAQAMLNEGISDKPNQTEAKKLVDFDFKADIKEAAWDVVEAELAKATAAAEAADAENADNEANTGNEDGNEDD